MSGTRHAIYNADGTKLVGHVEFEEGEAEKLGGPDSFHIVMYNYWSDADGPTPHASFNVRPASVGPRKFGDLPLAKKRC